MIIHLHFNNLKLLVFTGASFKDLKKGGSQGGQIIFLADNCNNCNNCNLLEFTINQAHWLNYSSAEVLSLSDSCNFYSFVH